jgi:hypothetical protein
VGVTEVSLAVNPTLKGVGWVALRFSVVAMSRRHPTARASLPLGERKIPAWLLSDSIWLNLVFSQPCFEAGNAETVR